MPLPLPIETSRLTVREFDPAADAEAMAEVYCDPEVMHFIPGGALADEHAVRALPGDYAAAQTKAGFSSWAIEVGHTLARRFWGLGYATEAARACLAEGLRHLGRSRIIAAVDAENLASIRVAERLGMTRAEDVLAHGRPHLIFSTRATTP